MSAAQSGGAHARPLVLLPSSKAKADGGTGPAYADCLDERPMARLRSDVLDALTVAADAMDDVAIMRLCAVKSGDVGAAREQLAGLPKAPTMPAHRRYTGVVHRFANLDSIDPATAGVEVATFGGLGGVVLGDELVPNYRLEVTGRAGQLGVLGTWWRQRLEDALTELVWRRRVWDLLPGEFTKLLPKTDLGADELIAVTFLRADGRAAPSASAKVAKGHLVRVLLTEPQATPASVVAEQPLEDWRFSLTDTGLDAVLR